MLEIWKMQHNVCSSQTKHPNYLNSAPVQISWNKRKEIRQRCYLLQPHSIGCTVTATDYGYKSKAKFGRRDNSFYEKD